MTREATLRIEAILDFAKGLPADTCLGIKPAHDHLLSLGIDCSYKTAMRDFKWLCKEGRLVKRDGLYWLISEVDNGS